jgi:hypothetical protein
MAPEFPWALGTPQGSFPLIILRLPKYIFQRNGDGDHLFMSSGRDPFDGFSLSLSLMILHWLIQADILTQLFKRT